MTLNTLQVTRGSTWRDKVAGGVVLRLPSNFVARVRAIQPDVLLKLGRIPDSLTPLVAAVLEGKSLENIADDTAKELKNYMEFVNIVCTVALIEPRVVENPVADDEIGIETLEWPDKVFLMGAIGATTHYLESFRDEQERLMDAVDAAKRDSSISQPDHEDPAVGA